MKQNTYVPTYHLTSCLSTYYQLCIIYLPIIYLSNLPTYLSLAGFVSLEKTDEHRRITEIQPMHPNLLHACASQWHSFEEQCAVFSQPEGLAEPERVLTGKLLLYFIHVSIPISPHLTRQAPLALTQDSVEILIVWLELARPLCRVTWAAELGPHLCSIKPSTRLCF